MAVEDLHVGVDILDNAAHLDFDHAVLLAEAGAAFVDLESDEGQENHSRGDN